MLFAVLKSLRYLILPPASILILMLIGVVLTFFRKRLVGRFLILVGTLLLYALSISPVSEALIAPLEEKAPPLADAAVSVDEIVVLGGGVTELDWIGLPPEPSKMTLERLVRGVALYRLLQKSLVVTGGTGLPIPGTALEANAMAQTARELGVPENRIIIENRSRNTLESAKEVRSMLVGNRILLVTSAFHMQRAAAMFRKQGFEVVTAPIGYHAEQKSLSWFSFIPQADSMATSSTALAEHLSLMWYSLINEL